MYVFIVFISMFYSHASILIYSHVHTSHLLPKAEMRTKGAGLGAPGSSIGVYSSSGTYKDSLKQLTRARFMDMFNK